MHAGPGASLHIPDAISATALSAARLEFMRGANSVYGLDTVSFSDKYRPKSGPTIMALTTLWLGGTSNLARTYINKFGCEGLLLAGVEEKPPFWARNAEFVRLDLTSGAHEVAKQIFGDFPTIQNIVIGVRPMLFSSNIYTEEPLRMLDGIRAVIEISGETRRLSRVLHVSSIAAIDHLRETVMVNELDPIPDIPEIIQPYDIFKRQCEQVIDEACREVDVPSTHLRLGAIFSDDPTCIQCKALDLQFRIGCYLPILIDCNSSANVAEVINAMVQQPSKPLHNVYYYTRPLHLERPVPYGYYLAAYRQAYGVDKHWWSSFWIPVWTVSWVVSFIHVLAQFCKQQKFHIPYLDAADYLLQVSTMEHTFDCTRLARDFPRLEEETILECFVRRKAILSAVDHS